MFHRSVLYTGIAACVLAGSLSTAQAASSGVMDCSPHNWQLFGELVEAQDNDGLRDMLLQPDLFYCPEIRNFIELTACSDNAPACIQPSGGGNPGTPPGNPPGDNPDDPDDQPADTRPGPSPFPGQGPGEPIGRESDNGNDDGGKDDDGGSSGGGGGSSGGGSTGGGTPGAAGRP